MKNVRESSEKLIFIQNHKNKVTLLLSTQKKFIYICTVHVELCWGFILITMAFHKFSRCIAKQTV
jgi:hypothetical protein